MRKPVVGHHLSTFTWCMLCACTYFLLWAYWYFSFLSINHFYHNARDWCALFLFLFQCYVDHEGNLSNDLICMYLCLFFMSFMSFFFFNIFTYMSVLINLHYMLILFSSSWNDLHIQNVNQDFFSPDEEPVPIPNQSDVLNANVLLRSLLIGGTAKWAETSEWAET